MNSSYINSLTQEIDILNSNAWSLNREDAQKSIELANKALKQAVSIDYTKGIAIAKKTLGACYVWTSLYEEAANLCFEAINLFQGIKDKRNEAETNYILGSNFFFLSDYDTSIRYYKKSYDLSLEINFEEGMADGLNGMGSVYYTIEQNQSALEVLTKGEKICRANNLNNILVKILDGIGETYYNLNNYQKALEYYNNCLTTAATLTENLRVTAFALDGLGRSYTGLNEFQKALDCFNKSLKIRKDIKSDFGVATTLKNIGKLYIKQNDTANAIKNLIEAFDLSNKIRSKEGIYQASEKLAELYEQQNDVIKALKFYKIFHEAKEEVRNHKSAQLSISIELQNRALQAQTEKAIIEEKAKELENFSESLVLMREVGQKIISNLSVANIVDTVYKSVNELMDAPGFGIGLFNSAENIIIYPLYIEGSEKFENLKYDLSDPNRLTSLCFNENKEIIINDFDTEINIFLAYDTSPKAGRNVESLIYLPLKHNNILLGVITVQSFSKNAYNNYHVNIFKNLATYTAIALENARLFEEQEYKVLERTKELIKSKEEIERTYETNKKLSAIGREITSNLNLGKIFKKLSLSVSEIMPADSFGVRIYKPEINSVEYKYEIENGVLEKDVAVIPLTDENNYTVWCIKNKQDIFLNDNLNEYHKYVKEIRVVSGQLPNSLLFAPMMIGEKIVGVITVQSFKKFAYQPHHIDILRTLGTYTAIALENAYLYENMEQKVLQRTQEVLEQKEAIERNFENTRLISEIGKEISNTFSIEEIISKVYSSINQLMDATMFGIGICDYKKEEIFFSGVIENGKILDDYSYNLSSIDRPAVWCFINQADYIVNNFTSEILKTKNTDEYKVIQGAPTESVIYLPLTQNNKKIGVITVQSYQVNAYSEYHVQLLKSLAIYTTIALDNASLYNNLEIRVNERTKEIEKNYNDTKILSEISKDLSSSLSIESVIESVYKNINRLMKADSFGLGIYNEASQLLEFNDFIENGKAIPSFVIKINDENRLGAYCFNSKQDILISDFQNQYADYIKTTNQNINSHQSLSIIYLPLYSKNNVIGVITVQSLERNAYHEYHLSILKNIGLSIGIAIDNVTLYEHLEDEVNKRTIEIVEQKEEIEKNFENTRLISEIGKEISVTFSIEEIISKVYNSINKLMDATVFGIGIYDEKINHVIFDGVIERGEKLDRFSFSLDEVERPAIICYINQEECLLNNYATDSVKQTVTAKQGELPLGIIYVPITHGNKKIGVITVQSFTINSYTNYHVQLLKSVAVYAAIALDNASLYNDLENRVKERTEEIRIAYKNTQLISEIAEDISSSLSVELIISKVYENVNKLMDATMFGIALYNPATNELDFKGFVENNQLMDDFSYKADDPNRLASQCFSGRKEIHINDFWVEYVKYINAIQAPIRGKTSCSIIYLPIFSKEKAIGVITVQSLERNAYSEYQFNILKTLALSVGIALDNASLYENLEDKINIRTLEVNKQKSIIEEKNKSITDSIIYAKKIQEAIAPNVDDFNKNFTDSFILYKPKDIVSGDFYWFEHFGNTTVFAAADCTGHGVPGAFMSLICSDIMYKVINDQKNLNPAIALKLIDTKLVQLIKKSSESSANDGMDLALCTYNKDKKVLEYAGAHRPIFIVRDKSIVEYFPNKFSIGGHTEENKQFDLNTIDVFPGDQIYLVTDGYSDQFGGVSGKKFKFKNLKNLILRVSDLPMLEQKKILNKTFELWKGNLEQVDDVCLIGVKI